MGFLRRSSHPRYVNKIQLPIFQYKLDLQFSYIGSLAYSELGTLIPKSGGEYAYYLDGLGTLHRFWGPLPAFLYSWLMILMLRPAALAAGCLSVANYVIYPILAALDVHLMLPTEEILIKIVAVLCLSIY